MNINRATRLSTVAAKATTTTKPALASQAQRSAQKTMRTMAIATAAALVALAFMTFAAFAAPSKERLEELKSHPYHGYSIIIQIDKAPPGQSLHAQRVRIHRYNSETGSIEFLARWDASTGMETPKEDMKGRMARRKTHPGYYNIEFLEIDAYSDSWDGPMPYAMYWDYNQGFAIHATEWFAYFKLGRRASAGCTRLHENHATELFAMIESMGKNHSYKLDRETGKPVRDANGNPVIQWTYQAMVLIEDHGVMEPTRFGFVDRNVVFASRDSYLDYMQPVAYGQSYPVTERPVLDLQNLDIPEEPENLNATGESDQATPIPTDPAVNLNTAPPSPQTRNEATTDGQDPRQDPREDPMFLENALLETENNASVQ